jgi:anti-sigma-K factor RskA
MAAYDRAIADYSAAIAQDANDASSLYARGLAKLKTGDTAGGNADIVAAKAIRADIADVYASHGIKIDAMPSPPASAESVQNPTAIEQSPSREPFFLTVDPQNRTMTVRRLTAVADSGRSYELWVIARNNPNPLSLGLVGVDEFTTRPLPTNLDADSMRAARYAISLEPAGGSPNGMPTGPILFSAAGVSISDR